MAEILNVNNGNPIVPGGSGYLIKFDSDRDTFGAFSSIYLAEDTSGTFYGNLNLDSFGPGSDEITFLVPDPSVDYRQNYVLWTEWSTAGSIYETGVTLEPVSGNDYVNVSSPSFASDSVFSQYSESFTVVSGDQVEWTDAANTTVNADGTFSQTTPNSFQIRVWDDSHEVWGSFQTITVGPVLSNPTATATGSTTMDGSVDTDTANGTLYAYISQNASETASTVKTNAQDTVDISSTGTKNVSFSGLSAGTAYYIHYMHEDDSSSQSPVETSPQTSTNPAPTLSNPTATATGPTTADVTVDTDTAEGTLYIYHSQNASENASTIKTNAQNTQSVSTTGTLSDSISGLAGDTSYYVHFLQEDSQGTQSNVVSSAQFTTDPIPFADPTVGNTYRNMKYFVDNGGTGKSFNTLAISYYQSQGATSRQFNTALKQAQDIVGFVGYSPDDARNHI